MFFVYVLQSQKNQQYYIGHTNDLERRIEDHNWGKSRSTRNRGPFNLRYKEFQSTKPEAIKRERQIKRYKGEEAFKRLIKKNILDPVV